MEPNGKINFGHLIMNKHHTNRQHTDDGVLDEFKLEIFLGDNKTHRLLQRKRQTDDQQTWPPNMARQLFN